MARVFSIDVTKLDKSRFKQVTRKDGTNAVFCDMIIMDRQDDFGNDGFVCQQCTKEEREKGLKMPILGNAKTVGAPRQDDQQERQPARQQRTSSRPSQEDDDDIPF